jgi:phospholipid transport system substrate-binding protein
MLRRFLLTAAIVLIAGAAALPAEARVDPSAFIDNVGRRLVVVVENPSQAQRRVEFRRLFHKNFDVHGLSWFVLGRFTRVMTPAQQREFVGLFENYVIAIYSDRLAEYVSGGGAPRVTGSRLDGDGLIVSSVFSGKSGAIRVDWRLRPWHHTYKITDLVVGGVSMAANGRSELEGVAERNGGQPEAILAVMRQEAANAMLR